MYHSPFEGSCSKHAQMLRATAPSFFLSFRQWIPGRARSIAANSCQNHSSADPRINDRARIQKAIDWVGRQPLQEFKLRDGKTVIKTRGAVLLQVGIYRIQGALILNKSGVVLRGEGNGLAGTILVAMGQFKHDFINMNGVLDSSFQGTPEYLARYGSVKAVSPKSPYVIQDRYVARVADEYVPVGTVRLPMKDVSNFKVGAEVVLETQ